MIHPFSPDDHSEWEPPDPMPNSAVKPLSADGSVGPPHARVGHRQAFIPKTPVSSETGVLLLNACNHQDCRLPLGRPDASSCTRGRPRPILENLLWHGFCYSSPVFSKWLGLWGSRRLMALHDLSPVC